MSRIWDLDGDDEEFANQGMLLLQSWENAYKGKRGQRLLKDLEQALLAMPEKKLIRSGFCDEAGQTCALGTLTIHRLMESRLTREAALQELARKTEGLRIPEEYDDQEDVFQTQKANVAFVQAEYDVSRSLAIQVLNANESCFSSTPEQRYARVLEWVRSHIVR